MTPRRTQSTPRGAALPLSLILLGVLTVVGVAAVSLAGRERVNAAAYARVDFINQCANAAQAKIWMEMTQYGVAYLGSGSLVTSYRLPDGTTITAPAHYDSQKPDGTMPAVKDVIVKVATSAAGTAAINERDCTNNACGLVPLGSTQLIVALCTFDNGSGKPLDMELELGVKFAL